MGGRLTGRGISCAAAAAEAEGGAGRAGGQQRAPSEAGPRAHPAVPVARAGVRGHPQGAQTHARQTARGETGHLLQVSCVTMCDLDLLASLPVFLP